VAAIVSLFVTSIRGDISTKLLLSLYNVLYVCWRILAVFFIFLDFANCSIGVCPV